MIMATPTGDTAALAWLPRLLQTTDSMFPTGAYAHSFGLEGAVQDGLVSDTASLDDFLTNQIVPALRQLELPCARHAFNAARDDDLETLYELDGQYAALKGTHELREASARTGRQRLALLKKIAPHENEWWEKMDAARRDGTLNAHDVIVIGAQGARTNIPLEAVLTAVYYQALAALVTASLKLIRIGQEACQDLLSKHLAEAPAAIKAAREVSPEDMGWFSPTLDIASARHETAYTRLFIT